MMINELQKNVLKWAEDKGILSKATMLTQINKTQEELTETRDAILQLAEVVRCNDNHGDTDFRTRFLDQLDIDITDGIGDQLVTLIILAELHGSNITECLEHAYNEIKGRTGEMVNGTFVKD
jgi:NTP pyrophosphatase (non-canonical NTP hydrolase)